MDAEAIGVGLPGYQLFDMTVDLGEQRNLCFEHPEIVSELTDLFWEIVTSGRSTPGVQVSNEGPVVWAQLPWS